MSRTTLTLRAVPALFLSLALAVPSPVFALRVSQPEDSSRRAGLEESLKPEQAARPEPARLSYLTKLARTLTGNYWLTMVPWQPLSENDWPQWRMLPEQDLLQYVPEDFSRFNGPEIMGLLFEALAVATTFRPEVVEPEYQAQGAFWALVTVLAISRGRTRILKSFPGIAADFSKLDGVLYRTVNPRTKFPPSQSSAFLQFLEGALYEGRRGQQNSLTRSAW